MCLACEQQEYFFRLWCADFLARGEMPPGVTLDDLQALGLPPPKSPGEGAEPKPEAGNRPSPVQPAGSFACDSPDE
jgi:hypothetical protein